jgi:hypothetical protein
MSAARQRRCQMSNTPAQRSADQGSRRLARRQPTPYGVYYAVVQLASAILPIVYEIGTRVRDLVDKAMQFFLESKSHLRLRAETV